MVVSLRRVEIERSRMGRPADDVPQPLTEADVGLCGLGDDFDIEVREVHPPPPSLD